MSDDEMADQISLAVAGRFPSFGVGSKISDGDSNNPIAIALSKKRAIFASGVPVKDVVEFVIASQRAIDSGKGTE